MKDIFIRKAVVTNVVDGDTIDVLIDLGFGIYTKERVRLLRVDCPEITGINKEEGFKSKAFTEENLLGKKVFIQTQKSDSWGRYLAEIFYKNDESESFLNFSDILIDSGMAIET